MDTRLASIRRVIHDLPQARFDLLKRLIEHLDKYVMSIWIRVAADIAAESPTTRKTIK